MQESAPEAGFRTQFRFGKYLETQSVYSRNSLYLGYNNCKRLLKIDKKSV